MEFSANNPIVKLCIQGMQSEEQGNADEASRLFNEAWNAATEDFEKFISAYFIARTQKNVSDKLKWLETTLQLALKINDDSTHSALPLLYSSLAKCYEELAASSHHEPADKGPFFHGTRANLKVGDLLTPGGNSNYQSDLKMNHIYFTALISGAGLAASLAKGESPERVYVVEPTGSFEHDPNVTNKKFPGNPTRSYRSLFPLKILREIENWKKQSAEDIQEWRNKLANSKGEIIN